MSPRSPSGLGPAPRLLLTLLCLARHAVTAAPPLPTGLPGPPGTAPGPPASPSDPPVLSFNLGLNFKIKVRSQGSPPNPGTSPAPPGAPALTALGSGWPEPGDEPGSGTPPEETGGWGGRATPSPPPAPQTGKRDKELELDVTIDLTAGLDPKVGAGGAVPPPPTSFLGAPPGPPPPLALIPAISELASKLGVTGFLVPTVPPKGGHEVPGGNGSQEQDEAGSGAEPAPTPGRQPSRGDTPPPPAASSACTPGSTCGSGGPDPQGPPSAPHFSWPPHFVALQPSWPVATSAWGPAWDAHVYGAAGLFALLALLGILAVPARGRPSTARFLGGLLAVAGVSRAFPLFFDPYERRGRLPPAAARLLFELPFPCLGWGLVLALGHQPRCRAPALAALGVLHTAGALGVVAAVAALGRLPWLLLVPRGLFVALVAALALWVLPRCGGGSRGKGGSPGVARGVAAGVAAVGAVLSAGLQVFGALQVLGWGGPPPPGPWQWWGLQLGCRLAEVAMGLPLAGLALAPGPPLRHGDEPSATSGPPNGCAPQERRDTEEGPLCRGLPELGEATEGGDPTAGYRPPSPIDLRRSIDEALGARPGIFPRGTGTGISVIGAPGMGADGAAGSTETGTTGMGTTGLPGMGTTATPGIGATGAGGVTAAGVTELSATGTTGLSATSITGLSTTSITGLSTTSTTDLSTTGAPGLATTGITEPTTTSVTGLGTTSASELGATATGNPGATGTTGTTGATDTTGTQSLGPPATPNPGTTGTAEPGSAGAPGLAAAAPSHPQPLHRSTSCGGGSPGARGDGGGGSPSPQGPSQEGPAAGSTSSPPPQGHPEAPPTLRPSRSWAGDSPRPPPAPQTQGGVPERPGDPDCRSQGSDTIDL